MSFSLSKSKRSTTAGFSVLELLILVALVGIVSALALTSFRKSGKSFDLSGATRNLSGYLQKARIDSISRHADATIVAASLDINSTSSYTANIDFTGDGTLTARTIDLPDGTSLSYTLPPATTSINPSITPITIEYDWRGRTTTTVILTLSDSTPGVASSTVVVGSAGDLSTDTTFTGPVITPTPFNTSVTTTTGIKSMGY